MANKQRNVFVDIDELDGILDYNQMTLKQFGEKLGISAPTLYAIRQGTYVSWNVAKKISDFSGVPMHHLCEEIYTTNEKESESPFESSETIILGLIRNITKRLSNSHSKEYIEDIVKVVNEIVIEASYLGILAHKEGEDDIIVESVRNRRKLA